VFSFGCFRRATAGSPTMTIKSLNFLLVQQVVASTFCRLELTLLNKLPHSDGSHPKNFSRVFCRNEIHQTHFNLGGCKLTGQESV
jgi:hypothetical protein